MKFTDIIKKSYAESYDNLVLNSKAWFVELMNRTMIMSQALVISDNESAVDHVHPGKLFFFFYDPKGKKRLPFYDRFPLVLPIEQYTDGFLGLNFHYLPPMARANLLDALKSNSYDDVLVTYKQIKGNMLARYCLKRYLFKHIQSRFIKIEPINFEWVLYLPLEHFEKKSAEYVWKQLG